MKDYILIFFPVPPLAFFLAITLQDYVIFFLKTADNFAQAPFVVGSLKSLLFRYYLVCMMAMTTVLLVHRFLSRTYNVTLGITYSILRIYAYVFLIINALNTWHDAHVDELMTQSAKNWKAFWTGLLLLLYCVNCKLSLDYHSMVDDWHHSVDDNQTSRLSEYLSFWTHPKDKEGEATEETKPAPSVAEKTSRKSIGDDSIDIKSVGAKELDEEQEPKKEGDVLTENKQ